MEFDKRKVFTALNADEVKLGSKGYFADSLYDLRQLITAGDEDRYFGRIAGIAPADETYRFTDICDNSYNLFYLVEEPEEKKFRPYKNANEMIEDFKKRYNSYCGCSGKDNPMSQPMIFIKHKTTGFCHLLTYYQTDELYKCAWFGGSCIDFETLYEYYTYLDGTPCGIEK